MDLLVTLLLLFTFRLQADVSMLLPRGTQRYCPEIHDGALQELSELNNLGKKLPVP